MEIFRNFSGTVVASVDGKNNDSGLYLEKVIADSVHEGEKILLLVSDDFSGNLFEKVIKHHGLADLFLNKNIISVIDFYSSFSGFDLENDSVIKYLPGPEINMKSLSELLNTIDSFKPNIILITSTRPFAAKNQKHVFEYFMGSIIDKANESNAKVIFMNSYHSRETSEYLNSITDLSIFFRSSGNNKIMEISSDSGMARIKYKIMNSKMEII